MVRAKKNYEATTARFPIGTFARIGAVSMRFESTADFIRETVLEALERREKILANGQPLEFDIVAKAAADAALADKSEIKRRQTGAG